METDAEEKLKKAQFFFEFVSKADESVTQANERVSKNIHTILSVLSTMITIIFGVGYFILSRSVTYQIFVPYFLSLVAWILSLVRGVFLIRPKWYQYVDPLQVIRKYKDKPLTYVVNKTAVTWADVIDHNTLVINSKESGIKQMLYLIIVGLVALAVAFLFLGISMVAK